MGCGYNASCSCGFGKHKAKPGAAPVQMQGPMPPPQGGQRMSEAYQSIDAVPIFNDSEDPQMGQRQSLQGAPGQRPADPNVQGQPTDPNVQRFSQSGVPADGQQLPREASLTPADPNAPPGTEAPRGTLTGAGGNPPGQEPAPYSNPEQQPQQFTGAPPQQ